MLMTESRRAFYFKETANSLVLRRALQSRGAISSETANVVSVAMLTPPGLSDQDAIARAHKLSAKRRGRIDGFEVWDGARLVIRHSGPSAESIE
jgi:hypothetical protein